MLLTIVLMSALSAPPDDEGSRAHEILGYALIGTAASDVLSTKYAWSRGGSELHPFVPENTAGLVAVKSGAALATWWATEEIRKRGHPEIALWMRAVIVAAWGYATVSNLSR